LLAGSANVCGGVLNNYVKYCGKSRIAPIPKHEEATDHDHPMIFLDLKSSMCQHFIRIIGWEKRFSPRNGTLALSIFKISVKSGTVVIRGFATVSGIVSFEDTNQKIYRPIF
jgi:hypothetical protein